MQVMRQCKSRYDADLGVIMELAITWFNLSELDLLNPLVLRLVQGE